MARFIFHCLSRIAHGADSRGTFGVIFSWMKWQPKAHGASLGIDLDSRCERLSEQPISPRRRSNPLCKYFYCCWLDQEKKKTQNITGQWLFPRREHNAVLEWIIIDSIFKTGPQNPLNANCVLEQRRQCKRNRKWDCNWLGVTHTVRLRWCACSDQKESSVGEMPLVVDNKLVQRGGGGK